MHGSPHLVVHRTEIWTVWRPQVGRKKIWRFLTQHFNCCTCAARCAGALSCWNTKLLPCRHCVWLVVVSFIMTSWNSVEEVSKRYYQNFLLCNNIEIYRLHCRFIQQFLRRSVCGCIFQGSAQQTISGVRNSIICLWLDNFCLQQRKNY